MLKTIGKYVAIVVSVLVFLTGVTAIYVNVEQKRSFTSWVIEKSMWMIDLKGKSETLAKEGMDALKKQQEGERVDLPAGDVKSPLKEHDVDGMQVITINDTGESNQPVIFYVHGGAYVHHAVSFTYSAADKLAKETGAKVVMPTYPLAPQFTYENAYPKMIATYKEVVEGVEDPKQITVMGDSAGGGFALGLGQVFKEENLPQPKQYILYSPWIDTTMENPDIAKYDSVDPLLQVDYLRLVGEAWAGSEVKMKDPKVSPIFGDFSDMAPIMVFSGTHELLHADIPRLEQALKEKKVPFTLYEGEKMNHTYPLMPLPEAGEAIKETVKLITGP